VKTLRERRGSYTTSRGITIPAGYSSALRAGERGGNAVPLNPNPATQGLSRPA